MCSRSMKGDTKSVQRLQHDVQMKVTFLEYVLSTALYCVVNYITIQTGSAVLFRVFSKITVRVCGAGPPTCPRCLFCVHFDAIVVSRSSFGCALEVGPGTVLG